MWWVKCTSKMRLLAFLSVPGGTATLEAENAQERVAGPFLLLVPAGPTGTSSFFVGRPFQAVKVGMVSLKRKDL